MKFQMKHYEAPIIFFIAWLALSLLPASPASAQRGTKVSAAIDKNSILIGEQIRLTLSADIPENEPIDFFQLDSLPHLEVVKADKIDTSNTTKGTLLKQVVYLTSFDSGHWVIPPLLLHDSIYTDSIPVDIGYVQLDPAKPYNDVKEILEAAPTREETSLLWWAIGIGVPVLALIAWLIFRRKKPVALVVKPPIDPYEEALTAIAGLRHNRPEKPVFYESLTNVFRLYLDKRKNIHSLQQTTAELTGQLKVLTLPASLYDRLTQSLRLGDLVKFARFQSDDTEDQETITVIKEAIELVEQQYQRELKASMAAAGAPSAGPAGVHAPSSSQNNNSLPRQNKQR